MDYTDQRRQYGDHTVESNDFHSCPLQQLQCWLDKAIAANVLDATAMHLATVDKAGRPDVRVVLLKKISSDGLIFFTDYTSQKSAQLAQNHYCAITLYWAELCMQVRVRGVCEKSSREISEAYFSKRPRASQLAAIASHQSEIIESRNVVLERLEALYKQDTLLCPERWGGYLIKPNEFEFFIGRDNRLNDRFKYTPTDSGWQVACLSP